MEIVLFVPSVMLAMETIWPSLTVEHPAERAGGTRGGGIIPEDVAIRCPVHRASRYADSRERIGPERRTGSP